MAAMNALLLFAALLLLVRAASQDPPVLGTDAFPDACAKYQGCSRVALGRLHRDNGNAPLRLRTTLAEAEGAAAAWLSGNPRTELLYRGADTANSSGVSAGTGAATTSAMARLLHARAVTLVFGFAGAQRQCTRFRACLHARRDLTLDTRTSSPKSAPSTQLPSQMTYGCAYHVAMMAVSLLNAWASSALA